MRTYSSGLKITSYITLAFFLWSFGPLFQIPTAIAAEPPKVRSSELEVRSSGSQPGERFEKALEAIREKVGKAEEKTSKNQDVTAEVAEIKTKKAEIESLDVELKKEFAATEKKLKDAKLPKEILDRHYKFVKHYEGNLKELKTNLTAIEKIPTTNQELRTALAKAKAHLEKTKAPSRHQKLDPNNLPFRTVKGKERAPRLKKEEFERDFPKQKQSPIKTAFTTDEHRYTRIKHKPILLAYNDIGSDVPLGLNSSYTLNSEHGTLNSEAFPAFALNSELGTLNLAAVSAADLPTAADLSETPEVQFTTEILAKAQELGNNPVKIYEWVRNNIEYAPTYGSIQGADQCLQSKICNDMDTASLLIALLRASGISARYVYSTIEIPIEKAMNWVGGVTDLKMAGTILSTNGIPAKMLVSSGTYKAVQLEHVYVSAFIDYIPSRGAVHKQGDTWIMLDPSFKQYEYKRGMDLYTAMGINGEKYLQDYITDTSSLTIPAELQDAFPAYTISPYQYYSKRLFNYIDANFPAATYQDIFGADTIESSKTIIKNEYPYLLGTLP